MIILRTPKGWTGPKEVEGIPIEGTFRAHQVPLANVKENAEHRKLLEAWMKSYQPDKLFDPEGRLFRSWHRWRLLESTVSVNPCQWRALAHYARPSGFYELCAQGTGSGTGGGSGAAQAR